LQISKTEPVSFFRKLYEKLKECNFAEINKIYDALQRGVGGKTFRSTTHQATIKKGKLIIERLEQPAG
jgi:hypothetical protein